MSLSRRRFVRTLAAGSAAMLGGRTLGGGRVIGPWTRGVEEALRAAEIDGRILLHNNENPLGPGEKALEAMRAQLTDPGIPAARYSLPVNDLAGAIAAHHRCKPENVLVGCGSTQILRTATFAFTSPSKPLVAGSPTYEECAEVARLLGAPIRAVPATSTLHHDIDAMAGAAKGAGLVFFDNPSNPAATAHPAAAVASLVERVFRDSPGTAILFDEAYHDYVTDPDYASQIPVALENPRVVVARTFSKAHGMAGLRVGYAIGHAATIKALRELQYGLGTNVLGLTAALASIQDVARIEREKARNAEVRRFTLDWFRSAGCASTDSQCNFVFVNIGRPARAFREACAREGVIVGREFPPFEGTHARISIGTFDEMRKAVEVFGRALQATAAAA